jgi:thiol:disulfide interchange protein
MFRGRMVAAALLVMAATGASTSPPGVRFRGLAEGTEEARRAGKPVLYFFTADWCGPCHDLKKSVFDVGTFARLIEEKYVPIEVVDRRREDGANAPDVEDLRVRMGVTGFPTLAVHRVDGTAAVRLVGFASRESSLNFLRDGDRRLREAEERERRAKK